MAAVGSSVHGEEEAPTEPQRVWAWRVRQFMLLGLPEDEAMLLADSRADLREFERLVAQGCDPTVAARILL